MCGSGKKCWRENEEMTKEYGMLIILVREGAYWKEDHNFVGDKFRYLEKVTNSNRVNISGRHNQDLKSLAHERASGISNHW